jgi:hypothetical protein
LACDLAPKYANLFIALVVLWSTLVAIMLFLANATLAAPSATILSMILYGVPYQRPAFLPSKNLMA